MLADALQFLIRTLLGLLAALFWLRFYLQWVRVPFHHPFAQFVLRLTHFAVLPLRRIVPGFRGIDWASLLLFLAVETGAILLIEWVGGYPFLVAGWDVLPGFALLGLAAALHLALQVLILMILGQAILSWVNPVSPASAIFHALTAPLLNPLRRILPAISGIDLSPLAAFILIELVMMVPVTALERAAQHLIR